MIAVLKPGVKLITMLPGLGKSTLDKLYSNIVDLEDYVGRYKYKKLTEDEYNAVIEHLSSRGENVVLLSSKWHEDFGRTSDVMIGAKGLSYVGSNLSDRGRPDLSLMFDDETLIKWNSDYKKYSKKSGVPLIELDLYKQEFPMDNSEVREYLNKLGVTTN